MANNFRLRIEGIEEFKRDVNRASSNYENLVRGAMTTSTLKIQSNIRNTIRSKGITNIGTLQRSVFTQIVNAFKGIIGVGEKYGKYVEFGTRPHFPPVRPIERWAQTKLGKSGIGFQIARKISRVGTKAQPYVKPAFEGSIDFVTKEFDKVGLKIVRTMAGR